MKKNKNQFNATETEQNVTVANEPELVIENIDTTETTTIEPELVIEEITTDVVPEIEATITLPDLDTTTMNGKTPGRPVVPGSKRQQQMLEKEIKRLTGGGKKGRPVDPTCKRQLTEKEKADKRAAGLLHPGRPKYTEEQKKAAEEIKAKRKAEEAERIRLAAAELLKRNVVPTQLSLTNTDTLTNDGAAE